MGSSSGSLFLYDLRVVLISDVLQAMRYVRCNLRNINELEVVKGAFGGCDYAIGNNVVVFRVVWQGADYSMRCYRRSKPYLRELYGERYFPNELSVGGVYSSRMVDVVMCDWVDGSSLSKCVDEALQNSDYKRVSDLAKAFDKMVLELVEADWAHGDLSPDNIVVDQNCELHLIDLDARYIPELKGCESRELGTSAYQPRSRTSRDFHSRIDDFSIAVISISLHALSLDPNLRSKFPFVDGLLFDGQRVEDSHYAIMDHLKNLFLERGYFRCYQLLKLLRLGNLKIDSLSDILMVNEVSDKRLELFIEWGLCGYCECESGEVIIPPLYDEAFEFRGDFALVRLENLWFYIDKSGTAVEHCGECGARKPPKIRPC